MFCYGCEWWFGKDLKGNDSGYFGAEIKAFFVQRSNKTRKFCQHSEPLNQDWNSGSTEYEVLYGVMQHLVTYLMWPITARSEQCVSESGMNHWKHSASYSWAYKMKLRICYDYQDIVFFSSLNTISCSILVMELQCFQSPSCHMCGQPSAIWAECCSNSTLKVFVCHTRRY